MRVWLLHIGEQLPMDGRTRSARYSLLARALAAQGHDVLRWAPTFCHVTKRHRIPHDARVWINDRYAIQLVHSPGYRRNVSLSRLHAYRVLGRRFRQLAVEQVLPDMIVAAIPSLEWAEAAVDFGRTHDVPVVIDVRDLWPDVLLTALPQSLRSLGRPLLAPYERMARRACAGATALVGVSRSYLDWALRHAGRSGRAQDLVVPLAYEPEQISDDGLQAEVACLRELGVDPSRPVCLFAGLFERSYDLETVIEAARQLEATGSTAQFVLCGDGSKTVALKRQAAGLHNVLFLGWVDVPRLQAVASVSAVGLCAYAGDALQSLPNKPFEYMAAGLPIISSLRGELPALVDRHQIGMNYRAGDAASLANGLENLLSNRMKLRAMGAKSHQLWSQQFRSEHVYSRFAEQLATLRHVSKIAA
jgi:glycosyltransferase involved in cell wall biosynthesis